MKKATSSENNQKLVIVLFLSKASLVGIILVVLSFLEYPSLHLISSVGSLKGTSLKGSLFRR